VTAPKSFEMPDLPRACVRCGTPYALTRQAVAVPRLNTVLDLPFCQACWKRVEVARRARFVSVPVAALILLGGLLVRVATGANVPLLIAVALCAAIVVAVRLFTRRALPRYKLGRDAVELRVPGVGPVRIPKG
jgi:hypothetical protein